MDAAAVLAHRVDVRDPNRENGRVAVQLAHERKTRGASQRLLEQAESRSRCGTRECGRARDRDHDRRVRARIGRDEPHVQISRRGARAALATAETCPDHDNSGRDCPDGPRRAPPFAGPICAMTAALSGAPVAFTHARKSPMSNRPLLLPWESRYWI